MITLSKKRAEKLESQGKLKPAKETVRKRQEVKVAKDISKAVVAIESTSKSIDKASTKISASLIKLANNSLKSAINNKISTKKKKWSFTILRDQKGLIKTVEAVEL